MKLEDFQQSLVRDWSYVFGELQRFGLSEEAIKEEFFFISNWLKESYSGPRDQPETAPTASTLPLPVTASGPSSAPRVELVPPGAGEGDEELPEYTPGKKPTTVMEKAQNLDGTTAIMNLETPVDQFGSSSGASPPAYTFDTESDQEMDEEFTRYIKNAIGNELKRRVYERDLHPDRCSYPYTWLPKSMRVQYATRSEIFTMLEGNSFTVMGYETAPWCLGEIDRLLPILRVSADGTGNDAIFNDGVRTLKIMASAMHKFGKVQDPRASNETFSDLDAMEYEASTAVVLDDRIKFPEQDFELAQKTHYMLLTYIMGMISLLKDSKS